MKWISNLREFLDKHFCRVEENGGGIATIIFPHGTPAIVYLDAVLGLYRVKWGDVEVEYMDEKEIENWIWTIVKDFYGVDQ